MPGGELHQILTLGHIEVNVFLYSSFEKAAEKGVARAIAAGCKAPLIYLLENKRFPRAPVVTALGALKATFVPLETREQVKILRK